MSLRKRAERATESLPVDCQLPIASLAIDQIDNRKSAIGNDSPSPVALVGSEAAGGRSLSELGFDRREDAQVQVFQPILALVEPVLFGVQRRREVLVVGVLVGCVPVNFRFVRRDRQGRPKSGSDQN